MISRSVTETIEIGKKLGSYLKKGDCVVLKGDLAGGKTTFTKGIGLSLGVKSVINSPTFNILKIYKGDIDLFHIDAYRLEGNSYDLGLDEYLDDGVMVIEWPEYYDEFLPDNYLVVEFSHIDDATRDLKISQVGNSFDDVIEVFKC